MYFCTVPSSCASTSEDQGSVSPWPFTHLSWYAFNRSTGSMMWGVLGGVRRQDGSRADLLVSTLSASLVRSSSFLSFWDKRRAPQELNSSRYWKEEGESGDGGDGGKAPEVAEGDGWLWTGTWDETIVTDNVFKLSRLVFGRMFILVGLACVGMTPPWMKKAKQWRSINQNSIWKSASFKGEHPQFNIVVCWTCEKKLECWFSPLVVRELPLVVHKGIFVANLLFCFF